MAKTSRAALTRLAATVTARYFPTSGATDGYYLDGRITSRREHRAADITLDREERGFFYSVFAHLSGSSPDDGAMGHVRKSLDRISADIKQTGRNIDAEINELAECAVSVAGRITLKHDGMRQPYFAGIMVRDSEMAAVTMGSGCAYLYRGDVLYPLTADDFQLDAIDYSGKAIADLDVYCAGVAGTVRYSNIAQLQLDDCLIVCNKEIMEALGQREILRMLYEAEDQADAAGLIITAASAKLPGTPMQFLIGFVESISTADKTGRLVLPRGQGDGASAAAAGGFAAASVAGTPASQSRDRYQAPLSTPAPAAAAHPPAVPKQAAAPVPVYDAADPDEEALAAVLPERHVPAGRQQPIQVTPARKTVSQTAPDNIDDDDNFGDEIDASGRGRRIAFYVIIAAICVGCLFLIYNMLFGGDKTPTTTTGTTVQTSAAVTTATGETTGASETGTSETGTTTAATETGTTTLATTTATTAGATYVIQEKYTVVAGDNLWEIAVKYYDSGEQKYIDLIKAANNMESDIIKVGQVLDIPVKPK